MRLLALILAILLLAHPARADGLPVIALWLDPRPLPAPTDAAAESEVFEQTLARTIGLFLPLTAPSSESIHRAAAAFAERKPLLLRIDRFDFGSPQIELVIDAQELSTATAMPPHREWAAAHRTAEGATPCLELFIDVDALRHTFLNSFADGRAGRVIHALGVPNARSLMLHGAWIAPDQVPLTDPALPLPPSARRLGEYAATNGPPLIRLDLSWNSRADEPTIVRGMNIAAGHWPTAQLKMTPPVAPFLCMFRMNARAWLGNSLAIRSAWLEPAAADEFNTSCATWLRANRPAIDRIAGALPGWLVVRPAGRSPDWFIAESPLRSDNASPDPIVREIDQLIGKQFADQIERIPDGGSRFPAPADWPLSVIGWNPNPLPPLSTVQFRIHLRGGNLDQSR